MIKHKQLFVGLVTPMLRRVVSSISLEDTSDFIPVGNVRFVTANELYLKVPNE